MAYGKRKSTAFQMKSPLNNGEPKYNKFGHRIMDEGELDNLSSVSLSKTSTGSTSGSNLVASPGAIIGKGSFSGKMKIKGDKGLALSTLTKSGKSNSTAIKGDPGKGTGTSDNSSKKANGSIKVARNFRMKGVPNPESPLGLNSPLNETKAERLARTKSNRNFFSMNVSDHAKNYKGQKDAKSNNKKGGKEVNFSYGDIIGKLTGTGKKDVVSNFRMKGVGPTQAEPKGTSSTPSGTPTPSGSSKPSKNTSKSTLSSSKPTTGGSTGNYLENTKNFSLGGDTKMNTTPMPKFEKTVTNARTSDYDMIRDKGRGRSSRLNTRLDKSKARTANRVGNSLDRIENRQQKSGMRYEKRSQAQSNKAENVMKGREAISGAGDYSQAQKNLDAFEKTMESPKATPRTSGAGNIKSGSTQPSLRNPKYQETTTKNSSFNPYKGRQSSGKVEDVTQNNKSTTLGKKTKSKVSMSGGRSTKDLTKTATGGTDFNYTIPSVFTRKQK